ncbi:MAG: hypothetical protein GY778_16435 [bacterium]|nr:hypothetical protein [bacterium]
MRDRTLARRLPAASDPRIDQTQRGDTWLDEEQPIDTSDSTHLNGGVALGGDQPKFDNRKTGYAKLEWRASGGTVRVTYAQTIR